METEWLFGSPLVGNYYASQDGPVGRDAQCHSGELHLIKNWMKDNYNRSGLQETSPMFHVPRLSSPRLAHVAGTSASSARLANANPQSHQPQDHSLLLGHDATWSFATIWTTFGGDLENVSCRTQTDVLSWIYSAAMLNLKCFVNWPLVPMYDIKIHSTTLSWDAPHLGTFHVLGGRKNAEPVDLSETVKHSVLSVFLF